VVADRLIAAQAITFTTLNENGASAYPDCSD
jgi:hypothetical protein